VPSAICSASLHSTSYPFVKTHVSCKNCFVNIAILANTVNQFSNQGFSEGGLMGSGMSRVMKTDTIGDIAPEAGDWQSTTDLISTRRTIGHIGHMTVT
jgi:hypothetical protein